MTAICDARRAGAEPARAISTQARQWRRRPTVVIIGAGFAGLVAARRLRRTEVDVIVVDRRNHHVFQPLLYQVATAGLNASDIAQPIRSILRNQRNVRVLLADVTAIEADARRIVLDHGDTLAYDTLIVAAGARHDYFGHDEWAQHAPGLKTIDDAIDVRRRVLSAFELAEREHDPEVQRQMLTFVIVGGGPTGVELAGAISEIAVRTMLNDFRAIDPSAARVVLVEGQERILGTYPESLSRKAAVQLTRLGVEVLTDCRVTAIDGDGIDTSTGRIAARTVLWAAGVAASPLARDLGAPLDRAGRVLVEPDLSVPGRPEILVAGDLAAITRPDGRTVPGVAPAATQAGRHVARAVQADLRRRPRPTFCYRDKGSLATIGRSKAVADLGRYRRLSGLPAWVLWWFVHLLYLNGLRNRFMVWAGWALQWLTFQREARLITGDDRLQMSGRSNSREGTEQPS